MFKNCWAYLAAILVALSAAVPVRAEADLKLPRERVTLVAPPFVHAHEQVAKSGPKIIIPYSGGALKVVMWRDG
jgi:nitrite reductase (NO-forming)